MNKPNDGPPTTPGTSRPLSHLELMQNVGSFVAFGFMALILTWGFYVFAFHLDGFVFVRDPAAWGQFGDFMGGTLNPILSFITLFLLALTLGVQSRQLDKTTQQLEMSREELTATRKELERSAAAQERSEKALRDQAESTARSARLAVMNGLYDHYVTEVGALKDSIAQTRDATKKTARSDRLALVRLRVKRLNHEFDALFEKFVGDE
jgi:hypothetical protein